MVNLEESSSTVEDFVEASEPNKDNLDLFSSPKAAEDEDSKKPNTNIKRCILIGLCFSNFWGAACMSLQAPFFPHEAESKGASPTVYGFIFGVFELAVVIMSPVYAKMIPRITPKFLAVAGAILEGVACCLFGLLDLLPAGNIYIGMAFTVRILEGFGAAASVTACFTICSAEFSDTIATSISVLETSLGFGLIVGPTIGGALFQVGGFILPFTVCGAVLILVGVALIFVLPSVEKLEPQPPREFKKFIFHFDILMNAVGIITALFYIGFNSATLEPHLRMFSLKPAILGLLFVISGGIYAFTTPIWGRMLDKGANANVLCALGYILVSIGLLFLGPVPFIPIETTLWLIILSLVFSGFGVAAKILSSFVGAMQNTCARGFPDNIATHSMVSALFSSSCSAGAFVGPTFGGFLLDVIGYKNATVVVLGIELFCLSLMVVHIITLWSKNITKDTERTPLLGKTTPPEQGVHISNG